VPSPLLRATRQPDGTWTLRVPDTGASLPLVPAIEAVLAAFDGGRTPSAAAKRLAAWPAAAARTLVGVLMDLGVLVPERDAHDDVWEAWGPEAQAFHLGTRDVPVVPATGDRPRAPSPIVRRSALTRVTLPPPVGPTMALGAALARRRTWRRMTGAAISIDHLATLLGLTFGVQAWADAPGAGWSALKSSPSGGARHSLEAYVCIRRVAGLDAGLYHYRPDRHRLDLLRAGCTARDIGRFLPGQSGYRRASVVCVLSSVLARVRWRYPHGRAYRVVLLEAGHLGQTFALAATALGLASFTTGALADSVVEDALGLSPTATPVVYAVGAGVRPSGVGWAPYAAAPPPRVRPTALGNGLGAGLGCDLGNVLDESADER
jgi:SagB-type dehydrogenase family enzyme